MPQPLLEIDNLSKKYPLGNRQELSLFEDLSFTIFKGETLGLVGESGCGKSTLGKILLRLEEPTSGRVLFDGEDLSSLSLREMKPWRQKMQMIFQNPYSSLNPRMTVLDIIGEALDIHGLAKGKMRHQRIGELSEMVGLSPDYLSRFPHEFSGGQRQRICIARALAVNPQFIVCDEPTSALDVSIQAQVINLLKELQKSLGLTLLFISHDLVLVKKISHRIAVMEGGGLRWT